MKAVRSATTRTSTTSIIGQVKTIVEVALGLPNPSAEFEKDILKAIMAQESGFNVRRLFFISRPGGVKKCSQPGRTKVKEWAHAKHGLTIEVHELEGEPRRAPSESRTAMMMDCFGPLTKH